MRHGGGSKGKKMTFKEETCKSGVEKASLLPAFTVQRRAPTTVLAGKYTDLLNFVKIILF